MTDHPLLTARPGPGPAALALAGWALVGGVVVLPALATGTWTPRFALLLLLAGPGVVSLVAHALRPDAAARVGLAYLGVAALSGLLADRPALAWWGPYLVGTGVWFVAGTTGAWSLGRRAAPGLAALLPGVILAVAAVNVAVAVVEHTVGLEGYLFVHESGRPPGLVGNPVFFGTLAAGAFVLLAARPPAPGRRAVAAGAGLVVLGLGVQLSGSRVALVVAAIGALAAAVRRGSSRGVRVVPAGALAAGVILAGLLPAADGPAARGGTERLATTTSAFGPRLDAWRAGAEAWWRRPVLGYGPGGFRSATSPARTLRMVRANGADGYFADAHNLVVEVGVTTGLVGLGLFVTWVVLAARRARGPLVAFAAAVGACTLVQPQQVYLVPLAALALGAADPRVAVRTAGAPGPGMARAGRVLLAVGMAAGLVAGAVGAGRLVAGDRALGSAIRHRSLADARRAERLLPPWPAVTIQRWRILGVRGLGGDTRAGRETISVARRAVRRDPTDPLAHGALGVSERTFGSPERAAAAYRRTLRLDPWSVRAMLGLQQLAARAGDREAVTRWQARICRIGPDPCRAARRLSR